MAAARSKRAGKSSKATIEPSGTMTMEYEVALRVPRERAWRALVDETAAWWHPGFHALAGASMRIEARLGGHMVEQSADGSAVIWGTVLAVVPGRSLDLGGDMTLEFGGPSRVLIHLEVRDAADGCVVRVTESRVGRVAADAAASAKKGWTVLLDQRFREHVARG